MANARILYDFNTWLAATVTESSEVSGRASSNVLNPFPGKKWVTTGCTSEWIVFDLGAAASISGLYINAHNFTAAATVTLEANTADSWGSPAYSQTLTVATDSDGDALPSLCFFLSESYRYWRLTVADASNPDGYISIGNIYAGQYYTLTRNYSDGAGIAWRDPSGAKFAPGSVEMVKEYPKAERFRTARVAFSFVSDAERQKWETIFRTVGNVKPLVLALDPDNPTTRSMYCYLTSDLSQVWQLIDLNYDIVALTFEEKTR